MAGLPDDKKPKPVQYAEVVSRQDAGLPPPPREVVPVQLPADSRPSMQTLQAAQPTTTGFKIPRGVARGTVPVPPVVQGARAVARAPTDNGTIGEGLAGGIGAVDRATIDADKANLAAYTASLPQGEVGQVPDVNRNTSPAPIPGERGNYNQANTSTVDSKGNITSNIKGSVVAGQGQSAADMAKHFGGLTPTQYLAASDQRISDRRAESERIRTRDQLQAEYLSASQALSAAPENDPQAQRHARLRMTAAMAGLQGADSDQLKASTEIGVADARNDAAIQAAHVQGGYGLQEAQIGSSAAAATSEAGLLKQMLANQGSENVAMIGLQGKQGANIKALQEAAMLQRQGLIADTAYSNGDLARGDAALGIDVPGGTVKQNLDGTYMFIGADGKPVMLDATDAEVLIKQREYQAQ